MQRHFRIGARIRRSPTDEKSSPRERGQQWTAQRLWDEEERELRAQEALWAAGEASVSQQGKPFSHRGGVATTRRIFGEILFSMS